jgi:hypothetical protein
MLYINAHLVVQQFGGVEEGGWYFSAGQPIASIPIATLHQPGKDYYLREGEVHLRDCYNCHGTGEVDDQDHQGTFKARCEYCGEVPKDITAVALLLKQTRALLLEEITLDRREDLSLSVEDHMAQYFPEHNPHYE